MVLLINMGPFPLGTYWFFHWMSLLWNPCTNVSQIDTDLKGAINGKPK